VNKLDVYVWPCGCVTRDSRTGPLEEDCGNPRCYRRTAPPVKRITLPRDVRRRLK